MPALSVRLKSETEARLRAYCERTGLTKTQVVEASLEHMLNARRVTFAEVAQETGYIGSFNGPSDLSENVSKYVKQKLRRKHGRRGAD
jgi:hypothetical protein